MSTVLLRLTEVSVWLRARTRPAKAPMPIALPVPVGASAAAAPSTIAAEAENSRPSWRLADSSPRSPTLALTAPDAATGSKLNRLPGLLLPSSSTVLTTWAAASSIVLSTFWPTAAAWSATAAISEDSGDSTMSTPAADASIEPE